MKASELMIGDLVFIPKLQKVFKVMGIENDHDEIKSVGCHIPMRMLDPIPLTEEILTANFILYHESEFRKEYDHESGEGYVAITLRKDYIHLYVMVGSHETTLHIKVMYVHQLQHALRLCGLNDLADNFKIE